MPSTLCNPKLISDFLAERLTNDQRLRIVQVDRQNRDGFETAPSAWVSTR